MLVPTLSLLPPPLLDGAVLRTLSSDCQAYLECAACGWEQRVDVLGAGEPRRQRRARCTRCGRKKLGPVRHLIRFPVRCRACRGESEVTIAPGHVGACPLCGSADAEAGEAVVDPPFPDRFGDLRSIPLAVEHVWGESGERDARLIDRESRGLARLPDAHRYDYPLILFAAHLRVHYDDAGVADRFWASNVAGNLCQRYFRATGELERGALALAYFDDMVVLAPDDATRAMSLHSYAMGAFSILARYPEDAAAAATGRDDLRGDAIAAAVDAERFFEGEGPATQLARVRAVLGDLLRVGEADDDQRRTAIGHFAQALEDPATDAALGFHIRTARAQTILELAEPDEDQIAQAVEDLSTAAVAGGAEAAREQWRPRFLLGQEVLRHVGAVEALPHLSRAASLALQQLNAFGDEMQMLHQADRLVPVFETLACVNASVGWVDEALSAVEITRGVSVRLYSMLADERDAWQRELLARHLEDTQPASRALPPLVPTVSTRHIEGYFEENPIGPAVEACLRQESDVATAFLCLFLSEWHRGDTVATALLCRLEGADGWTNTAIQWRPDADVLAMLERQDHVAPGPFRERLVLRACALGRRAFLDPVLDAVTEAGVGRLILSVPGVLGRLPFEAFGVEGDSAPLDAVTLAYLPSVRVGADLAGRPVARGLGESRVLAVGYDGPDMARRGEELESLQRIWGRQLTLLPGADCTKASVLDALRGRYDLIHFMCHGIFDEASPLESALHFSADRHDDRRRLTARELLMGVRLRERPLVILSACSSVMAADSRTNSLHGLPGSFFRAGARAMVGSRWPVHDDGAAVLMGSLHRRLRESTAPADVCLSDARLQMRAAGAPTEDWAAFAYFGVA